MPVHQNSSIQSAELKEAILKFEKWLEKHGYASFDPYDIWGTPFALKARELYYRKNPIGLALIMPVLGMDIVAPGMRSLFVKKERYATADAQLILAFLNMYAATGNVGEVTKAKQLAEELLQYSIPGYSGYCWGYPFDWQWNGGLSKRNTPFITATPYCFEAFLGLYDATDDSRYLDIARSIAEFVANDLCDTPTGPDSAAGGYAPADHGKVFNASAYRVFVLMEADARWNVEAYRTKAVKNLNFILQGQQPDGSWLYGLDNPAESFIDHFHTCFVLKNLWKANKHVRSEAVASAIHRGFDYYREALFWEDGLPKSYAISPRTQLARLEMYNFAEAITLCTLLKDDLPQALQIALRLASELKNKYQVKAGHFVTRVFLGGVKHTFPFLRWPQAQLFYALTTLFKATQQPNRLG